MGKIADKLKAEAEEAERIREERRHQSEVIKLKAKVGFAEAKHKQAEEEIEILRAQLDAERGLSTPNPKRFEFKPRKPSGQATAVIVLSDWHVEETVDPETINGLNEYNLDIASKRIQKTFENALVLLESARHLSNIKDLVVAVIGDMISGYIHEELKENNSLSPVEALEFFEDHLVGGLDLLWKHSGCKTITVPTCVGNHGRTTQKIQIASEAANSYEYMSYRHLEKLYRVSNPAIQWKVERGYHNWLDIQGKHIRFHHGHSIKYGGGIGGPMIPLRKAVGQWNKSKTADGDICGHLHAHMNDGRIIVNNSLIGYGPFSLWIKADYSPPSQTFMVYDQARPRPVTVQEIWCD